MGFRENRALARHGLPDFWARGPGPMLGAGEVPISYAHYLQNLVGLVGVFLTNQKLYMLDVIDSDCNYERRPGTPLTDLVIVGRVNGLGGGWAFTEWRRTAGLERGPLNQVSSWLLYPRAAVTARLVSRIFLRELQRTVGSPAFVGRIKLRPQERDAGYRFEEEMLKRACTVSPDLTSRVAASSSQLAKIQRQEAEAEAEREATARELAEQERVSRQESLERERREAEVRSAENRREARVWRAEGSPEKRRRRAEWEALHQQPPAADSEDSG